MQEMRWKKVTYPGVRPDYYLISEYGHVMNIITGKILSPYIHNEYPRVNICADKKYQKSSRGYSVFVHRLVAWEFIPNPNNYPVVNHLDGNKENSHFSNLEWTTYRDNNLHARQTGLISDCGYNHSNSIFSEELARSICEKLQDGWSIKEIFSFNYE